MVSIYIQPVQIYTLVSEMYCTFCILTKRTKYDVIKCNKMNNQRRKYLTQGHSVKQRCWLSPTLFNLYINELADQLDRSAAPGLIFFDTEIRYLLYAD